MLNNFLLFLHLVAVTFWIGGMALMHLVVRPTATELLEPSLRLPFMALTLTRFFRGVSVVIVLILITGLAMLLPRTGAPLPIYLHIMSGLGLVMMLVFADIRFRLLPRLQRAVAATDWPAAALPLAAIRQRVVINLSLGLVIFGVVTLGRGMG